jgi:hypothetical protein
LLSASCSFANNFTPLSPHCKAVLADLSSIHPIQSENRAAKATFAADGRATMPARAQAGAGNRRCRGTPRRPAARHSAFGVLKVFVSKPPKNAFNTGRHVMRYRYAKRF